MAIDYVAYAPTLADLGAALAAAARAPDAVAAAIRDFQIPRPAPRAYGPHAAGVYFYARATPVWYVELANADRFYRDVARRFVADGDGAADATFAACVRLARAAGFPLPAAGARVHTAELASGGSPVVPLAVFNRGVVVLSSGRGWAPLSADAALPEFWPALRFSESLAGV